MTEMTAAILFQSLPGVWSLKRSIVGSQTAQTHGVAIWHRECTHTIKLQEKVQTHTNGTHIEGSAIYLYQCIDNCWQVYTQSPQQTRRLLHIIDFNIIPVGPLMIAASPHLCAADYYYAYYDFNTLGTLRIVYVVRGPNKHYSCTTELKKS